MVLLKLENLKLETPEVGTLEVEGYAVGAAGGGEGCGDGGEDGDCHIEDATPDVLVHSGKEIKGFFLRKTIGNNRQ